MRTESTLKSMLAFAAVMLNLSACNGQRDKAAEQAPADTLSYKTDTPQVDVRVNRQYDEHGNLIAFDSSYTAIYGGRMGETAFMDSMFKGFMPGFGERYPFLLDPGFNTLFFPDSSFHQDFFHHDFFQKRMEMNQRYMQRMMEEMDSLKNRHFLGPGALREPARNDGPGDGDDSGKR